jgi:hypothetical protein
LVSSLYIRLINNFLILGIDVGPALSLTIGGNKPCYELMGAPRLRSIELMKAASRNAQNLIISEEVYLALRPRHFDFDDKNPIRVAPGLIGYGFRQVYPQTKAPDNSANFQSPPPNSCPNSKYQQEFAPHKDIGSSAESTDDEDIQMHMRLVDETQTTNLSTLDTSSPQFSRPPDLHSLSFFAQQNQKSDGQPMSPKHSMFDSMNSSASELYSIDLSVETGKHFECDCNYLFFRF